MKIFREGELNTDVMAFIRANVRSAETVVGDLRAQFAANHVGAQRLAAICRERGWGDLQGLADEILSRSERLIAVEICGELPAKSMSILSPSMVTATASVTSCPPSTSIFERDDTRRQESCGLRRVLGGDLGPDGPIVTSFRAGRFKYPVAGILGGGNAPRGELTVNGEPQPSGLQRNLVPGDVLLCRAPGGAGLGDPRERDPAAVARDLEEDLISEDYACRHHDWQPRH